MALKIQKWEGREEVCFCLAVKQTITQMTDSLNLLGGCCSQPGHTHARKGLYIIELSHWLNQQATDDIVSAFNLQEGMLVGCYQNKKGVSKMQEFT
jgi:hypothetical protein